MPIEHGEGTPRLDCATNGGRIGHTEVCHMTEIWMDLFDGIARLATELPDIEILLVGDHAPPILSRASRQMFAPGCVPWIRLTPRAVPNGERVADLPLQLGAASDPVRPRPLLLQHSSTRRSECACDGHYAVR